MSCVFELSNYLTWSNEELDIYLQGVWNERTNPSIHSHLLHLILYELRALRQRQQRTDEHLEAVFRPATPEE